MGIVLESVGTACTIADGDALPGVAFDCAITRDGASNTSKDNPRFRIEK